MNKRLFIAAKVIPTQYTILAINNLKNNLSDEKINWIGLDNMHITIHFFGEIEETQIDKINKAMLNLTANFDSFEIEVNNAGAFKSIQEPQVIWLGIRDSGQMQELHKIAIQNLQNIGYKPDKRDFRPHLTLGRIKLLKNKQDFQKLMISYKNHFFQKQIITHITLYESLLKPEGAKYQEIIRYNFKQ